MSTARVGVGLVFGFRRSLRGGYYWGMAFTSGRFVAGEPGARIYPRFDVMAAGETSESGFIDIEVLKFGKRF